MKKSAKRMMALILSLVMVISAMALNVSAVSLEPGESFEGATYSKSFSWLNLTEVDGDFESAIIASDGIVTTGKPSTQWSTAAQPTGSESWTYQNRYLKPSGNGSTYLMTLKDTKVVNFRASIEFLNAWKEYGIYFGQSTPTDIDLTKGATKVKMQENAGKIWVEGVSGSSAKFTESSVAAGFNTTDNRVYDQATRPDFDSNVNSSNLHTLNIEVLDGVLKVWWTGYETYAWTVELGSNYSGGYISLYSNGCAQGGIKTFNFEDLGGFSEYEKTFTGIDVATINRDFNSAIVASDGTVTAGKASNQWSTAKQPTGGESWEYQNTYLKPTGNGNTYLLTLNNTKTVNFRASIEFLNAWREYGIYFGQSTPTDIAVSDTTTSGVVKVRMQENAGKILVQGVDAATTKWVDVSKSDGFYYNADKKYLTYDQVTKFSTDVNSTNLHTLNIEVINGLLKVWWTGFEEYAWTVELNGDYKGGYISLYSTGCQQGGIKSFTFEDLGGYIQSFSWLGLGEIESEFTAAKVAKDGTITTGTPAELWSTDVNPSGSTNYDKQNHYLKPKTNDGATHLLTLKDVKVKNFRATMEFLNNWHDYGIYFGQSTSTDIAVSTTTTSGAVKVGMQGNAGKIQAVGVDNYTAKWEGTQDYGAFYPYKDASKIYTYNNADVAGFDSNVNSTNLHTLNIEVVDGLMKVWWSEYPDVVWSASLNENYEGGYISLYSTGNAHGGIKNFAVMELPESDYTFTATDETELDSQFTSTVYNTADGTVTTTQVSESWRKDNLTDEDLGKGTIENIYYNNGLKPFGRVGAKKLSVLTLNDEISNNFELNYTYILGHTEYGIYLSDGIYNPNALPEQAVSISINNAKIGSNYYPLLKVQGAIDIESASLTNENVTMYNYGGNTVSSYLSDLGLDYSNAVNLKQRVQINVKVENGTLTTWVTGYEGAAITVKLTAKYVGNKLSLYTNGCDQGGLINLNKDALADDAKKSANIVMDISPAGEYTAITMNTTLAYSKTTANLLFDNSAFEYYSATMNLNQILVNGGKELVAENGILPIELYTNAQGNIATIYFKNLKDTMDYSKFKLEGTKVSVLNNNSANHTSSITVEFDYTEDYILNVKDVVRAKTEQRQTVADARKVLVGANTEAVSPLLGKTALYLGDSIAYGANDTLLLSWAGRIAQRGMTYDKVAVSGWTVTNKETSGRGQIVTQLDSASKTSYDFVILEGGVNDVLIKQNENRNINWGEVSSNSTNYDDSTIAGAIEDLIVKTKAKFPNAIVGYVINNYFGANEENMTNYINIVKAACAKHDVAYVDLNADERTGDKVFYKGCQYLPDNLHPNAAGYDIIAQVIAEWMEELALGASSN